MRNLLAAVLVLLIVGCSRSYQPVSFAGPAQAPGALQCARGEMQDLGYVVGEASPAPASITGIRIYERSWLLKLIGYRDTANQLTATVSNGRLQVTAISSDPGDPSEGGPSLSGDGANAAAERDARRVFNACSTGA